MLHSLTKAEPIGFLCTCTSNTMHNIYLFVCVCLFLEQSDGTLFSSGEEGLNLVGVLCTTEGNHGATEGPTFNRYRHRLIKIPGMEIKDCLPVQDR